MTPLAKPGNGILSLGMLSRALLALLSGKLSIRNGHWPPPGHVIASNFTGVGVAAGNDPASDDYLLARLRELGLNQVRLDLSPGDLPGPAARLLQRLTDAGIQVLLHLVQPYAEARAMATPEAQQRWQAFIEAALTRFGKTIAAVEIGATINRRRWAGYDHAGFFAAWGIAHAAARRHGVTLAGPNITDFEPIYNLAVLERLARIGQLPDIHTDNLFSERVIEPERFDHRILGFEWAKQLKVNLVKKARILQSVGAQFGVPTLVSPAAFWTLPRIERVLPDSEQKQADYLTRYLVLCAASGALRQAFWGPLICHREGLIDDGSGRYPALERITHYAALLGNIADYRLRPAFQAMRAFNAMIPGARYLGAPHSTDGLELHMFAAGTRQWHVIWTANGKALPLTSLYAPEQLAAATYRNRDGEAPPSPPAFASESPLYLGWPAALEVNPVNRLPPRPFVGMHRHDPARDYYLLQHGNWHGVFAAENPQQAAQLRAWLNPQHLPRPQADSLLRKARNAIWTLECPGVGKFVAKQPLKQRAHKRLLDRRKPAKARRSWDAAAELLRRGISTAQPLAYLERRDDHSQLDNIYLCAYVEADCTAREMLTAFAQGAREFHGVPAAEAYRQLCQFLLTLHGRGVFFRDLSGGNILIRFQAGGKLEFTLIDINRAHFTHKATVLNKRIADLTRICNKLHWAGREELVGQYLAALGKQFFWHIRLRFALYDTKVALKRAIGRKAIRALIASRPFQ